MYNSGQFKDNHNFQSRNLLLERAKDMEELMESLSHWRGGFIVIRRVDVRKDFRWFAQSVALKIMKV
jgi:hypothetical protein